ncbi:MAG: exodeoxyribonuclease V subunit alpha [Opitutales bacterium]
MKKKAGVLTPALVEQLLSRLRPLDISLAIKVYAGSALAPKPSPDELVKAEARLFWLAALTSYAQSHSHSGLLLNGVTSLHDCLSSMDSPLPGAEVKLVGLLGTGDELVQGFPDQVVYAEAARDHPHAIFIYRSDAHLIYLHRWYAMEAELGAFLRERLRRAPAVLPAGFAQTFSCFFKPEETKENPWQAAACVAALRHDFSVVTGGPGTGKTTTITRLIGLLLSLPEGQMPKKIKMVAPTGKAAERMREAFAGNFDRMLEQLPEKNSRRLRSLRDERIDIPSTIHSYLGFRGLGGFRHHAGNPLDCDALIIDEATMVDLELFLSLFRALPERCRVILLGDKNQLAAVETGNVFSDLTAGASEGSGDLNVVSRDFARAFEELSTVALPQQEKNAAPICGDHVVELVKSYRFSENSPVGQVARSLINEGRLPGKNGALSITAFEDDWHEPLRKAVSGYRSALSAAALPEALLEQMNASRVLCGVRRGEHGVNAINRLLSAYVLGDNTDPGHPRHGLPFMIRTNDKSLNLWNGDCGVFYKDSEGELGAYFTPASPGSPPRRYNPYALPEWEAAFALTIHKSQGSEYATVVVVLAETKRPFINWELVYTAVTRARHGISLVLPEALMGSTLPRARRTSGLRSELVKD